MRAPTWLRGLLSRRAAPWPDMIFSVRMGTYPTVQRTGQRIELHLRDWDSYLAIRIDFTPHEAEVMGAALAQRAAAATQEAYQEHIRSQRLSHEDY